MSDETPKVDEIKRVYPWAAYWCVDCPYCNKTIEDVDEGLDFGRDSKCPKCGEMFYIENGPL